MKWIALLGLLLARLSLQAQSIIPVPVTPTNGQFLACWYSPPFIPRTNNIYVQPVATFWLPEVSTDGVNWTANQSEVVYLPSRETRTSNQEQGQLCLDCLHFIAVYNQTDQVRIRLVAY